MNNVGLIGLGVMGKSLALNMANNNYSVAVYNHNDKRTKDFMEEEVKGSKIKDFYDLKTFSQSLEKPRKIILMTVAGEVVDEVIQKLLPFLEKGDLLIDGGNTFFKDTDRRMKELKEKGIKYLGMGVSGGEEGALKGPSIMPGGDKESYEMVKDILLNIAAKGDYGQCCTYIGDEGAGHFVKMIHNGIEYAMMQAISEVYHILKDVLKLSYDEIGDVFEEWNKGELNSYLMEITHKVLKFKDEETSKSLVDLILDKAGQKGTGRWTAETGLELGIPTPSLNIAVEGRIISFFKEDRVEISKLIKKDYPKGEVNKEKLINDLEEVLLFSNVLIFSQGLWLIEEASKEYGYNINTREVLQIWSGGCIIRARILDYFIKILEKDKENINLLKDKENLIFLHGKLDSVKSVLNISRDYYIPCFVINSSLDYFYSMIQSNLPSNLIQGQRDFFGAHTYNRIDKEGVFHTIWE